MAIAYDSGVTGTSWFTTSYTLPFTIGSWKNRIMIVAVTTSAGCNAPTYNWVTMSNSGLAMATAGLRTDVFYLVNPTSWTNNLIVTNWWSTIFRVVAVTYTWVHQTTPINAQWWFWSNGVNATNTIVGWTNVFHVATIYYASTPISAWSWTTERVNGWQIWMYDANWLSTWSHTLNITTWGTFDWQTAWYMLNQAPADTWASFLLLP